jgi:hypothetical protein
MLSIERVEKGKGKGKRKGGPHLHLVTERFVSFVNYSHSCPFTFDRNKTPLLRYMIAIGLSLE